MPFYDYGVMEEMGRRGAEEVSVEWRIPNFPSLLHGRDGVWYDSPKFRMGDGSWQLGVQPNWKRKAGNPTSGCVRLDLFRFDGGPPATVRFSVGIRGSEGVEKSREGEREFKGGDWFYTWNNFCSRSFLLEHRTRLMPDDTLTIRCVLKRPGAAGGVCSSLPSTQVAPTNRIQSSDKRGVCSSLPSTQVAPTNRIPSSDKRAGVLSHPQLSNQVAPTNGSQSSDKRDACTQTDCNVEAEVQESTVKRDACAQTDCNLEAEVIPGVEQSTVKRGGEKVLEDIAKLLDSGEGSDVTVQVGDVEFKVHRNILSVRSPVLAAMFRHETEERATNSIKIDDCDPDVFREYLHYLYTGSVHSLTQQAVFDLYRIADKYLAEELEQMCLDHIKVTLSVETFCDTVRLALAHGEDDLLQLAIDFAARNIPTIIRSVEWQYFIREFPTEANEILIKCIKL